MQFNEIATLAVLVCNIAVVVTGIVVVRNTIRRFRFTNIYGLWMKAISDEHHRHFNCVRNLLLQGLNKTALIDAIESDEDTRASVLYVVDHWTVLGTGIRYGLFDRSQAIWMNYQQILHFFDGLQPWLAHRRMQTPESTIFHDFGWLYLQCRKDYKRINQRGIRPDVQQLFSDDRPAPKQEEPPNNGMQGTANRCR